MEPGTEVYERVRALEVKVNGGPGEGPLCKLHKDALDEFKKDLKALTASVSVIQGQLRYWAGGLALLFVLSSIFSPFIREIASAIIHKP